MKFWGVIHSGNIHDVERLGLVTGRRSLDSIVYSNRCWLLGKLYWQGQAVLYDPSDGAPVGSVKA